MCRRGKKKGGDRKCVTLPEKNVIMDRILPFFTFQSQTISDTKSLYFHERRKGWIRVTKTAGDSTKNKYSEIFAN